MKNYKEEEIKYLELLAEKFPTVQEVCTEIINLQAILNLPKGTEHFLSDFKKCFWCYQSQNRSNF